MNVREQYTAYLKRLADRPGLWEVNGETREHAHIMMQGETTVSSGIDHQTVLYARAGEQTTGYAVSQCLDEAPEALLQQAAENGLYLEGSGAAVSSRAANSEEEEQRLSEMGELKSLLRQAMQLLPPDVGPVSLTETIHSQWVANQKGLSRQYSRRCLELEAEAYGRSYIMTAGSKAQLKIDDILADMADMQKNQQQPGICKAGVYRAVLSNYVMAKLWITGWQLFSGRQYAAGTGAFYGRLSQKIASEKVTLQDLPAMPEGGYDAPFDCEGSDGKAVDLVKDGRFCGLMHNLESAARLGAESTGNGGRTAGLVRGTDIIVTPKNFVMKPGEASTEELLTRLGDGLYIFDAWDEFHAVNAASGQFSFPCSAVIIKGGKRQGVVHGMTMNGNVGALLQNVEQVGSRLCRMPLLMHKTYQVAAPAVLVSGVSVNGNA